VSTARCCKADGTSSRPRYPSRVRGAVASVLVVLTVAASAVVASRAAGSSTQSLLGVNFISVCAFSHRGPDDPIVFPRQPGMSHDHTFVGNSSTDAFSTPSSLHSSSTSCFRKSDTAAYWMPTLFDDGAAVIPKQAIAYYRRSTVAAVKPFPVGLEMIAGNSHASGLQSIRIVYWDCGGLADVPRSSTIPSCSGGSSLNLHVRFPDCWNGHDLRNTGEQHVDYSSGTRCPRGYPVAMPTLELVYRYPVPASREHLELASGGQNTGHADFVNSWKQPALARLVTSCLNRYRHCGTDRKSVV